MGIMIEFPELVFTRFDCLTFTGDFNLDDNAESLINDFQLLLFGFNLEQHVHVSTHVLGHTLDLGLSNGIKITVQSVREFPISGLALCSILLT